MKLKIKNKNIAKLITKKLKRNREKTGLFFSDLLKVYLFIALGLSLLMPMLYIKSQIYYTSRDISTLLNDHAVLLEENLELQRKIEGIKFKNQIIDTLEIE